MRFSPTNRYTGARRWDSIIPQLLRIKKVSVPGQHASYILHLNPNADLYREHARGRGIGRVAHVRRESRGGPERPRARHVAVTCAVMLPVTRTVRSRSRTRFHCPKSLYFRVWFASGEECTFWRASACLSRTWVSRSKHVRSHGAPVVRVVWHGQSAEHHTNVCP